MKSVLKKFIAVVLAVLMATTVSLRALALGNETYVKEMVIETGKSADEAKSKLKEAGYEVLDKNISNSANDSKTKGYMYIGYKTTTKANEAITDMRLMHMGGGYSYAEYEQLIKQQTEEINKLIGQIQSAVKEYRTNYNDKKQAAVVAYNMLNQFKEDDTGILMGDYLLDETKTNSEYTNVFLQCSAAVLISIEQALAIACCATNNQSILTISELDKEDFIGETQYENIATDIYNDLTSVRSALEVYANSGFTTKDNTTKEDFDKAFAMLTDEEKAEWSQSFAFASTLESIELSDGSNLYDLFMTDPDEVTTEDFYPLASLLSEGQASLINVAGLNTIITAAVTKDDKWNSIATNYTYKVDEPISVYSGVDRSLFEGGVALTNKAMVEAAANTEKAWYANLESQELIYDIVSISAYTIIGAALTYATASMVNSIASALIVSTGKKVIAEQVRLIAVKTFLIRCNFIMQFCRYTSVVTGSILIIAIGVFLIATAIYLYNAGMEYYHPVYDETPRILVEKNTNENDESIYYYYYSVKNTSGEIVDINQHDGPRWMTLYTTKDKNAGKPILADFVIQGKNTLTNYTGLRKFSQDSAFDMNKFSYNLNSSVKRDGKSVEIKSSYLFYKQSSAENNFASIFTGENILLSVCSLGVGIILSVIGTTIYYKKRNKNAT